MTLDLLSFLQEEEKAMVKAFGKTYVDYMRSAGSSYSFPVYHFY